MCMWPGVSSVLFPARTPATKDVQSLTDHIMPRMSGDAVLNDLSLAGGRVHTNLPDNCVNCPEFGTAWRTLCKLCVDQCDGYVTSLMNNSMASPEGNAMMRAYDALVTGALPDDTASPVETQIATLFDVSTLRMTRAAVDVMRAPPLVGFLPAHLARAHAADRAAAAIERDPDFSLYHNSKFTVKPSMFEVTVHVASVVLGWFEAYTLYTSPNLDRYSGDGLDDDLTVWDRVKSQLDAAHGRMAAALTTTQRRVTELNIGPYFEGQQLNVDVLTNNITILGAMCKRTTTEAVRHHARIFFAPLQIALLDQFGACESARLTQLAEGPDCAAHVEPMKALCTASASTQCYHAWADYEDSFIALSAVAESLGLDMAHMPVTALDSPCFRPVSAHIAIVLSLEKLTKKPSSRQHETRASLCFDGLADMCRPYLRPPVPLIQMLVTEVRSGGLAIPEGAGIDVSPDGIVSLCVATASAPPPEAAHAVSGGAITHVEASASSTASDGAAPAAPAASSTESAAATAPAATTPPTVPASSEALLEPGAPAVPPTIAPGAVTVNVTTVTPSPTKTPSSWGPPPGCETADSTTADSQPAQAIANGKPRKKAGAAGAAGNKGAKSKVDSVAASTNTTVATVIDPCTQASPLKKAGRGGKKQGTTNGKLPDNGRLDRFIKPGVSPWLTKN